MSISSSPPTRHLPASDTTSQPGLRFLDRCSGEIVDSIWSELRLHGLWRRADFDAHEENTLKGAGDRSDWLPIFAEWFPLDTGQDWCPQTGRALDPVHLPNAQVEGSREDFLKAGQWTRASLDAAMHHAFQRATELAPDRFAFAYRFAESFYDLERPDWDAALKAWSTLEEKAPTPVERQTMRLHAANICLKLGKRDHAKALLATVDDPKLQGQKQRLLPLLASPAKK